MLEQQAHAHHFLCSSPDHQGRTRARCRLCGEWRTFHNSFFDGGYSPLDSLVEDQGGLELRDLRARISSARRLAGQ